MAKLGTNQNPAILRVQHPHRAHEIAAICEEHGWIYVLGVEEDKPEDIFDLERLLNPPKPIVKESDVGRNDPCPCGSGKKYKKCCLNKKEQANNETSIEEIPKCGLCGKTTNLTKTPCCDQWICDDMADYKLFSYERNSCSRNHSRYTLCGYHYAEDHKGDWKTCEDCKNGYNTELYVYFGTNEYNFEKLKDIPEFEYERCAECGGIVKQGEEGFSGDGTNVWCEKCTRKRMETYFK